MSVNLFSMVKSWKRREKEEEGRTTNKASTEEWEIT
jgi:hypothetical protein